MDLDRAVTEWSLTMKQTHGVAIRLRCMIDYSMKTNKHQLQLIFPLTGLYNISTLEMTGKLI